MLTDRVEDRILGARERQAVDDDAGQRLARHVDARPEGLGAQQHGVDVGPERLHERGARLLALAQDGEAAAERPVVGAVEVPVGGEEAEGAPSGLPDRLQDVGCHARRPGRIGGVGEPARHDQQRLVGEVEGRLDDELARRRDAELGLGQLEGLVRRERGRCDDGGVDGLEQQHSQPVADLDRLDAEHAAVEVVLLDEDDGVGVVQREPRPHPLGGLLAPLREPRQLAGVAPLLFGGGPRVGGRRLAEQVEELVVRHEAGRAKPDPVRPRPAELRERVAEGERGATQPIREEVEAELLERGDEAAQRGVADAVAEEVAGDVRRLVGLVEHDDVEGGQDDVLAGDVLDDQVREQQVVVGDDDGARGGPRRGEGVEAGVVQRAVAAGAVLGADREAGPERAGGLERQLGDVAGPGALRPADQRLELVGVIEIGDEFQRAPVDLVLQEPAAEVVAPPLHQRERERDGQQLGEQGQVLADELVLQRDVGGDDQHLPPGASRVEDGGHEVGEALPGAGGALDEQVLAVDDGELHGAGHLDLAGAGRVAVEALGQQAVRAEDVHEVDGDHQPAPSGSRNSARAALVSDSRRWSRASSVSPSRSAASARASEISCSAKASAMMSRAASQAAAASGSGCSMMTPRRVTATTALLGPTARKWARRG